MNTSILKDEKNDHLPEGSEVSYFVAKSLSRVIDSDLCLIYSSEVGHSFSFVVNLEKVRKEIIVPRIRFSDKNSMDILVVDDAPLVRKFLKKNLRSLGFARISEATDGLDALEKVRVGSFDLVFMDRDMPNLDGVEATKIIRSLDLVKQPKILFVSGHNTEEIVREAMLAGANDFYVKPFKIEALNAAIETYFSFNGDRPQSAQTEKSEAMAEVEPKAYDSLRSASNK